VVQAGQRLPFVGPLGVAAAVAAIHLAVGVQEEHRQGQVVVELEQIEVNVVNAGEPDADEVVGKILEALETDNLPVENMAGDSRHAAQHDHQRLAGLPRSLFAGTQAGQPAVPGGRLFVEARPFLGQRRRLGQGQTRQC
jgi:hypothetical protein